MVPVGLMWGNDLVHVKANQMPTEQWINTARDPQLHLGFRGLLNGPIDNPQASCIACHGFAQVAKPSVSNPTPALPGNTTWSASMSAAKIEEFFTQIKAATALSSSYQSLDYSLQLQIGVTRLRNSQSSSSAVHAAGAAAAPLPEVHR